VVPLPLHVAPAAGLPLDVQVYVPEMRRGELVNVMALAGQVVVMPPDVPFWAGSVDTPLDGTAMLPELAGMGCDDVEPRIVQVIVDAETV